MMKVPQNHVPGVVKYPGNISSAIRVKQMSRRLEQDNKNGGIPVAEFRRSYFRNGRYAGTVKTSGSALVSLA